MQDSQKYNEDFDKLLKETKILTKELFEKFYDSYSYDTATTHNWLVKKLIIIKDRIDKGDTLPLENSKVVLDKDSFLKWIETEFPNTKKDLI
jgi:hypothetical protein